MNLKTYKLTFAIVRHFTLGFSIASPTLNECLHLEINLGCFLVRYWGKGESLIGFKNYWIKQT